MILGNQLVLNTVEFAGVGPGNSSCMEAWHQAGAPINNQTPPPQGKGLIPDLGLSHDSTSSEASYIRLILSRVTVNSAL